MKPMLALSCLVVGAALWPAASFAAAADGQVQSTPKAVTQDSTLAAKIKAEMAAQHLASLSSISVDADAAGVVTLAGYALSQDDIDKTVSIARSTTGVTAVNSSVTIKANQ